MNFKWWLINGIDYKFKKSINIILRNWNILLLKIALIFFKGIYRYQGKCVYEYTF